MSFKDQLAVDAVLTFLNSDEFSEEIVYQPKNGSPRTIKAIVDRQRISPDGETDRTLQNQIEIRIANHATYGVDAINRGGDTVILPERVGGVETTYAVVDILGEDEGMWNLLLQK